MKFLDGWGRGPEYLDPDTEILKFFAEIGRGPKNVDQILVVIRNTIQLQEFVKRILY